MLLTWDGNNLNVDWLPPAQTSQRDWLPLRCPLDEHLTRSRSLTRAQYLSNHRLLLLLGRLMTLVVAGDDRRLAATIDKHTEQRAKHSGHTEC